MSRSFYRRSFSVSTVKFQADLRYAENDSTIVVKSTITQTHGGSSSGVMSVTNRIQKKKKKRKKSTLFVQPQVNQRLFLQGTPVRQPLAHLQEHLVVNIRHLSLLGLRLISSVCGPLRGKRDKTVIVRELAILSPDSGTGRKVKDETESAGSLCTRKRVTLEENGL